MKEMPAAINELQIIKPIWCCLIAVKFCAMSYANFGRFFALSIVQLNAHYYLP